MANHTVTSQSSHAGGKKETKRVTEEKNVTILEKYGNVDIQKKKMFLLVNSGEYWKENCGFLFYFQENGVAHIRRNTHTHTHTLYFCLTTFPMQIACRTIAAVGTKYEGGADIKRTYIRE